MATGVDVSKANLYGVLDPPVAENVSKGNAYAALLPPVAGNVSKGNAYAALDPPIAANVSKAAGRASLRLSNPVILPVSRNASTVWVATREIFTFMFHALA
jgi:hypothetical protein